MSTFPLDQMDEYLLKQIVRKFTATSGAGFYCSCRGAKDFVDRVKPVWNIPGSWIRYSRGARRTNRYANSPKIPLEFSRIETVEMYCCDTDYIKTVVLPEVAAIGRVGRLNIAAISDSDAQLLITAAKPKTVELWDKYQDPTSPIFENIKNLCIYVVKESGESYWKTTKLFEFAKNRRSITLHLWESSRETIASFIVNWLKGEKTGTLERLTFIMHYVRWTKEDLTMKGFTKTEGGYILERGFERLRITANSTDYSTTVDFYFS